LRIFVAAPGMPLTTSLALERVPVAAQGLHVFSNPQAFPRARFVPRVEIVADPDALLARLGENRDDFSTLALVEQPPVSGFLGDAAGRRSHLRGR
jgi:hypothetical protein